MGLKLNARKIISSILEEARSFNLENNITGLLLYRTGIFVQILEGDKTIIENLLGKITLDRKRHENLKVILKQEAKSRIYSSWSMNYREVDNGSLNLINAILPWQSIINSAEQGKQVSPKKIIQVFEKLSEK